MGQKTNCELTCGANPGGMFGARLSGDFHPKLKRRTSIMRSAGRSLVVVAGAVAALVLSACGAGRQDVNEPNRTFTVEVPAAKFPASQRLSQHTQMVISVRNVSSKTVPDVAITICNVTCKYPAPPGEGSSAQAFAQFLNQPYLANQSRPVWVVDQPPGPCQGANGYSCQQGGPGGAVTAYSNTWALGKLKPGETATFIWRVTAAKPGAHTVAWEVAAGLNGKAKAILPDGSLPHGAFTVNISKAPAQAYVTDSGRIVKKP